MKKMITIYGTRQKCDEFFEDMPERHNKTILGAMRSIIEFELGYGGQVSNVETRDGITSFRVQTQVLNCLDTTYCSGPESEMKPLLKAIQVFRALRSSRTEEQQMNALQPLADRHGSYNPMMVVLFAPLLLNLPYVAISVLVGLEINLTAEGLKKATTVKTRDFFAALELALDEGLTLEEAMDL